jgi:hypothetical protein
MHREASSLVFQETLRELMVKKEEVITEREERQRKEKEATTKSFVDLQLRALEVEEASAKFSLVEAEAKAKLMDVDAKSKVLEAEAKIMAGENRIMLMDLATIDEFYLGESIHFSGETCHFLDKL